MPPTFAAAEHDRVGSDAGEPSFDLALPGEVERRAVDRHHLAVLAREPAHERRTDHAAWPATQTRLPLQRIDDLRHGRTP